jgi:hypothetical protein
MYMTAIAKVSVWTAPAVQEKNLTFQRAGRVQPCIWLLNVAADPDGRVAAPLRRKRAVAASRPVKNLVYARSIGGTKRCNEHKLV